MVPLKSGRAAPDFLQERPEKAFQRRSKQLKETTHMHTTLIKTTVRGALAAVLALTFTPLLAPGQFAVNKYDFNGDGHPDIAFLHGGGQTAIWYFNNNVLFATAFGPTLPPPSPNYNWTVFDTADFNGDRHPDFLLFNLDTRQTAIWYMNNNVLFAAALGPTIPLGWGLAGIGDFNGDGRPDFVLGQAMPNGTVRTAIWYMNNNVLFAVAFGPTIPDGWSLVGIADFNGDGHPDWVLFNSATGQTAIWYMRNNVLFAVAFGPTIPHGWIPGNIADYNGDGHPDFLLQNLSTRQLAIWYLNNNVLFAVALLPSYPFGWTLVTSLH
jgi:hypothetical protein